MFVCAISVLLMKMGGLLLVAGCYGGEDGAVLAIRNDGQGAQFYDRATRVILQIPELTQHGLQARVATQANQL